MAGVVAAKIKKIEQIIKAGKDLEPTKELFPDIDLTGPPICINAVQTDALTPTEAAYYFASTSARAVLSDK